VKTTFRDSWGDRGIFLERGRYSLGRGVSEQRPRRFKEIHVGEAGGGCRDKSPSSRSKRKNDSLNRCHRRTVRGRDQQKKEKGRVKEDLCQNKGLTRR